MIGTLMLIAIAYKLEAIGRTAVWIFSASTILIAFSRFVNRMAKEVQSSDLP